MKGCSVRVEAEAVMLVVMSPWDKAATLAK